MSDAVVPTGRRRLSAEDTDVTDVPAGARGARVLGVAMAGLALVVVGMLWLLLLIPSSVLAAAGLAETVTAEVTDREFRTETMGFGRASGRCAGYRFTVSWADREGTFDVCMNNELADLELGERLEVRVLPYTDEVTTDTGRDWSVLWFSGTLLLVWWTVRGTLRHFALAGGRARGPRWTGTVDEVGPSTVTVRLDHPEGVRLRLLATMRTTAYARGQRATVWASGASRWRGRPHGPWAARLGGEGGPVHASTHAWVRR